MENIDRNIKKKKEDILDSLLDDTELNQFYVLDYVELTKEKQESNETIEEILRTPRIRHGTLNMLDILQQGYGVEERQIIPSEPDSHEGWQAKSSFWQELEQFAKEQGFEVVSCASEKHRPRRNLILLPLGQIADIEYGISLGLRHNIPVVYARQGDKLKCGTPTFCYTPEIVIRTAEIGDKKYIIERQQKKEINQLRGLIWAFKFKDQGTIDPSYLKQAYSGIVRLLPKYMAKELISNKISELEEKLEEVEASNLPEVNKIIDNITKEFLTYANVAQKIRIIPKIKFPNLAEKGYLHFANQNTPRPLLFELNNTEPSLEDYVSWCEQTGNPIKKATNRLIKLPRYTSNELYKHYLRGLNAFDSEQNGQSK